MGNINMAVDPETTAPDIRDQFITRVEAAKLWGCTRANIHYHIGEEHLSVYDVGGVDMLLKVDVKRLMTDMKSRRDGSGSHILR